MTKISKTITPQPPIRIDVVRVGHQYTVRRDEIAAERFETDSQHHVELAVLGILALWWPDICDRDVSLTVLGEVVPVIDFEDLVRDVLAALRDEMSVMGREPVVAAYLN